MPEIQVIALRTLGGIMSGDEGQTQTVIKQGVLQNYKNLLQMQPIKIIKEACYTLSNITAGNHVQIEVIINAGLIDILLELMSSPNLSIQIESYWVINNAIYNGSVEQVQWILSKNVIKILKPFLDNKKNNILKTCLDCYLKILKTGQTISKSKGFEKNFYIEEILQHGIDESIEKCVKNPEKKIYKLAIKILEGYIDEYDSECVDTDECDSGEVDNDIIDFEEF
ncbi:importin subunit alpha-4 [Anaeramoeba flamelloides]|uniref:Importin subunit alpha-4 n=1 Tax=Anaeramoeba flamelloides TaxID=1746091 RepID=A0AAV7Z614_9EUKA|nr:importin subunit alpha-4 [Anaeramoeba flamelloides]